MSDDTRMPDQAGSAKMMDDRSLAEVDDEMEPDGEVVDEEAVELEDDDDLEEVETNLDQANDFQPGDYAHDVSAEVTELDGGMSGDDIDLDGRPEQMMGDQLA